MTFFKNCVKDSDLARDWRSVVGDDDAATVFFFHSPQNISDSAIPTKIRNGRTFNNRVMAQVSPAPSSYFLNKSLCEPVRVSVNMSASPEILMWF
ncbi:hypothetical protein [Hallerella succinigenes]|uniref:Uncharacterized protein n=1 Tax=Hallerella succinigenes TaxID=1896222 RepID=A0A2M9A5J1_9BACT|nr:hypothetical protein [Hallerella succinigenes]PJJ40986.1 hypothetical protein BGX16_0940 [Hallerella succinigenes]